MPLGGEDVLQGGQGEGAAHLGHVRLAALGEALKEKERGGGGGGKMSQMQSFYHICLLIASESLLVMLRTLMNF